MAAPPAGFAEVTFIFQLSGRPRQATWGLGIDSANFAEQSPEDIASLAYDAMVDTTAPYLASHMIVGWSFVGVNCVKMLEDGPISGQHLDTVDGTQTGGAVPVNTSVLLTKQTAGGGRRNRGRAYIPPVYPLETNVDGGGVIDGTQVGQLQGWYGAGYDRLVDVELQPVLFHQSAPFTPTVITAFQIGSQMATQRRRMRS
jgi:hypothetical protein